MSRCVVIGVGNPDRGDDAAGLELARRLGQHPPRGAEVRVCTGGAFALLEAWRGSERAVLVDAAEGGGRPGAIHRFEAHRQALPAWLRHASTHSPGLAEAVELARSLGELPPEVVVYAIEGGAFGLGGPLSPPVRRAIGRVEARIVRDLDQRSSP
jgi:hydrogenase maturation protease